MGKQARNYSPLTIKKLYALSGNECSFPGCSKQMVNLAAGECCVSALSQRECRGARARVGGNLIWTTVIGQTSPNDRDINLE